MADDHAEWLRKQGAKVVGQRTLRHLQSEFPRYLNPDTAIDFEMATRHSVLYQIEVPEDIVKKWEYHEARLNHVIEYAERMGSMPASYFLDNSDRHRKLLEENQMYRDAWREFQSIRALLGETPHWP